MFFEKFKEMFFPRACGVCGKKINKNNTCEKCSNILQYTLKRELCVRNLNSYVDKLVCLFEYKGIVRDRILDFKFSYKGYIAVTFANLMYTVIKQNEFQTDVVIPVPIHKSRKRERGFNQSQLLSHSIAKRLKIKHEYHSLIKYKNNLVQSTLNEENRKKNVIGVYKVVSNKNIVGKRILLVDDIYTTGSTVNECAKILKQNGAKEVIALTIAYARRKF